MHLVIIYYNVGNNVAPSLKDAKTEKVKMQKLIRPKSQNRRIFTMNQHEMEWEVLEKQVAEKK